MLLTHDNPEIFDHPTTTTTMHHTQEKVKPSMTPEEKAIYEKTITDNLQKFPSNELLMAVTCSITKNIFVDPGRSIKVMIRNFFFVS